MCARDHEGNGSQNGVIKDRNDAGPYHEHHHEVVCFSKQWPNGGNGANADDYECNHYNPAEPSAP